MAGRGRPRASEQARLAKSTQYRQVLVDAAEQEFAEQGFEAARIQRVAERAGLSVGTLYGLFASKAELYAAVHLARGRALLDHVIAGMQAGASAARSMEQGIEAYVRFYTLHPSYLRLQLHEGQAWAMAQKTPVEDQNWQSGLGMVAGLCQRGITAGEFLESDAMRMAKTLTAIHQVQLADWVERDMSEPAEQLVARLQALFRRLYCR